MSLKVWNKTLKEKCQLANDIHLSLCNAIELATLRAHGQNAAATLMWKMLRRHQIKYFLTGLHKLGLDNEVSDAVKSGKYHYFSNILGGLDIHYVEESPEKVWIRYPPPYSMSDSPFTPSVGIAAFAPQVGHATFHAWHAYNGTSLGNPKLGFVLTQVAHQGDPCHEGYFKIFDHDLSKDEKLQFSPREKGPIFDPSKAPKLPVGDWNEIRASRALRNYAVEYVTSHVAALMEMYGASGTHPIVEHAARVTYAQLHKKIVTQMDLSPCDVQAIAMFIKRDREMMHEEVEFKQYQPQRIVIQQKFRNPRLFPPSEIWPMEVDEAITRGWQVFADIIVPGVNVDMTAALSNGDPYYEWIITHKPA